jgi:aryl-alcohol dehydrogenase-like predicted oxidoreductase
MGMSGVYGPTEEQESIATIHAALDAGINLVDTGDFYGMGHNEMLIGRALAGRAEKPLLSVKFGSQRGPNGVFLGFDARPSAVKTALAYTLQRLKVDHVDVYRPARLDMSVPIEETVGAIGEMIDAGFVRHVGLSEVGAETIRRAHGVRPVVDLQIEYSLISRTPETKIFPALEELGIAVTAYGVLSRGLLSGATGTGKGDMRGHMPRFKEENRAANQHIVDAIDRFSRDKGCTASQLAIAWVLAKGPMIIPVIGARTRKQLAESLGALDVKLSASEIAEIETTISAMPVAGTRYAAAQMQALDSER